MRVRTFPAKLLPAAALFILLLTAACGGDEVTPEGTEAGQPVSSLSLIHISEPTRPY